MKTLKQSAWKFERSSGYAGYRCQNCGTWVYSDRTQDGCKCTNGIHGRINARANIVNKTMANHNFVQDEVFFFSLTIEGYKKYEELKEYTAFYGKKFYN